LLDRPADDPVLVRVVQLRERTRIMPRLSSQSPSDANRAAGIDLVRLLLRHHGPDIGGELAERVREYETRLMELAQARLELLNELLYQARARRDGLQDLSSQEGVSKHITEADAFTRSHHALATLNAATLPRLVPLLDVSVGNALTDEFNRAAYPPAYEDRFEMRQALAAAFALPDLLPSQRDDLFTLQMEYREQYETARRGVIEACAAFPIAFPRVTMYGTAAYQAAHARYERESSKALEERAAVNRRALRGLRLTLSPAQLRKLPLPEVE
jgi:hypothetical protein